MTENTDMWPYWRDKRGIVDAVECDYPKLLESNHELQLAITMIKAGETLIDRIMNDMPSGVGDWDV
jgi:hypothetical protein